MAWFLLLVLISIVYVNGNVFDDEISTWYLIQPINPASNAYVTIGEMTDTIQNNLELSFRIYLFS